MLRPIKTLAKLFSGKSLRLLCTITVGLFLSLSYAYGQTTHTVTNTADSGAGSLRDVIAGASSGDIIEFSIPANSTITLTSGEINCGNRGLTIKGKIAHGDTLTISGKNNSRIFFFEDANHNIKIERLKFIDGRADENAVSGQKGGAIYSKSGNRPFTMSLCRIINCTVDGTIGSSNFAQGGALNIRNDYFTLINCVLKGNKILTDKTGAEGGGVFAVGKRIIIRDNIISGNTTDNSNDKVKGGGVYTRASERVYITNNIIDHNTSIAETFTEGGGLYVEITETSGLAIIIRNTINDNAATVGDETYGAGIYAESDGELTITTNTIDSNTTSRSGKGGGAYAYAASNFIVKNNTIVENISDEGGGIYVASGTNPTITSNIIALNEKVNGNTDNLYGVFYSGGYNIFSDAPSNADGTLDQTNVTEAQLNLGTLQDNGGTTLTRVPLWNSVALNLGNPNDDSDTQNGSILQIRDVGSAEFPHRTALYVANATDAAYRSLRYIINQADSGDTIRFLIPASSFIELTSGEINCGNKGLIIEGKKEGYHILTISGGYNSRILGFYGVQDDIHISHIKFINGGANTSDEEEGTSFPLEEGGAIYCTTSGSFTLSHCELSNNEVSAEDFSFSNVYGGGLYIKSDVLNVNDCIIRNNKAFASDGETRGGGVYADCGSILIENSTITSNSLYPTNSRSGQGAGIYAKTRNGDLTMVNNTIAHNKSTIPMNSVKGGGMYLSPATATIVKNNTIVHNTSGQGAGICFLSGQNNTVSSNIIALNNTQSGTADNIRGNYSSSGYNIFSDAPSGANSPGDQTNVTEVQLNLGPLQDNGGHTPTMLPLPGSVAIDAGDPSDMSDAQNAPINGIRDIGAAESLLQDIYRIATTYYNTLQDAINALNGSVGNILLMKNHTELSFSGTLPSNATLTIPTGLQLTIKDPNGLKDNNSTKKKE